MTTDLDQELLLFVAAHELVLAQQAAALLQIDAAVAMEHLELLRAQGSVSRVRIRGDLPPAYRITREGAEQIDSALPPLWALDVSRYRHEVAVAWLWVAARHGQLGNIRHVLSRREMQAADSSLRSESLLNTAGATFRSGTASGSMLDAREAYPDLGLIQADDRGGWATLDVLLALPTPAQLRTILARAPQDLLIRAQLLLVEDESGESEKAIHRAAVKLGLLDQVHVQVLARDGVAGA